MNVLMESETEVSPPVTRWKRLPVSLRIFLVHTVVVALSLGVMVAPLPRQPGAIHPVQFLPCLYLVFCPLVYLLTLVVGMRDVFGRPGKVAAGIAVGGSVLALAGICRVVAYYWDAMMYV